MVNSKEDNRKASQTTSDKHLSKRLIVFADGTGNAFGGRASNIWRLYEAIDKREKDEPAATTQLARYIPGVGTSSIGIIRILDGATGFGVPANVKALYRFLCWNWEPGVEIWMFGFSRGAFTLRTLAGLINSQGLMPSRIDGQAVTPAEMMRNSKGAWRAYRTKTAPFWEPEPKPGKLRFRMSPLVSLGRAIRDALVTSKRRLFNQMRHDTVLDELRTNQPERAPGQVDIEFLGLFDTVEAYGVPLEEVRTLWDIFIWPISFRNRVCSPAVKNVRHALSLDEERLSFQPLRFDQTGNRDETSNDPEIKEVWFAGVHSDVGGGYADDEASLDPLLWMIREAEAKGISLIDSEVAALENRRTANAIIHDSRSGLKSAYRYWPRKVESGEAFGGDPTVDASVVQKIKAGNSGYAPIMLSDKFRTSDGQLQSTLRRDQDVARDVKRLVLRRRIANIAFLALVVFLLLLPWTQGIIWAIAQPDKPPASLVMPDSLSSTAPKLFHPWLQAIWTHPWVSVPTIVTAIFLYFANTSLRDRIRDTARRSWINGSMPHPEEKPSDGESFARTEADAVATGWVMSGYRVLSGWVVPALLAVVILSGVMKVFHVAGLSFATATGMLCEAPGELRDVQPGSTIVLDTEFSTSSVCWSTGLSMVQGRTYWISLEETASFGDGGNHVPIRGFETNKLAFVIGKIFRREDTSWFRPVAQIGETGASIAPLDDYSGSAPEFVNKFKEQISEEKRPCGLAPGRTSTGKTLTARFQAEASGPLFLYVNDAIFWPWTKLYSNNTGCARVIVSAEAPKISDWLSK
ncbi:DUF2235 domain-containing protein [Litoreibacter arenae]|uniref:Peptidoglycan binding domain protein n=1 Tax=Litoreibacter arenae DSM 19593 TaxID=1123360 RepID=S9Q718_9RHOB|nr:DUF2235 domain-containing protein [Litoreibacter arenae]EPX77151.1 peptidoglycan binding domain protein [Litoreibacter arenae DSM 19593]